MGNLRQILACDRSFSATILTLLLVLLPACATINPAEGILGEWQTDLHGFPISVVITDKAVQVAGQPAVEYQLEGNTLKLGSDSSSQIQLEFPSRSEMLQTNLSTGEVQRFSRRKAS